MGSGNGKDPKTQREVAKRRENKKGGGTTTDSMQLIQTVGMPSFLVRAGYPENAHSCYTCLFVCRVPLGGWMAG